MTALELLSDPTPLCRTGKYYDAALANINAYNADLVFGQNCLLPYEPEHNTDMLIFAASMGGQVRLSST